MERKHMAVLAVILSLVVVAVIVVGISAGHRSQAEHQASHAAKCAQDWSDAQSYVQQLQSNLPGPISSATQQALVQDNYNLAASADRC